MPDFHAEFDPLTHTYTVDNIERISVTTCLPYNYRKDNTEAMLRGNLCT